MQAHWKRSCMPASNWWTTAAAVPSATISRMRKSRGSSGGSGAMAASIRQHFDMASMRAMRSGNAVVITPYARSSSRRASAMSTFS